VTKETKVILVRLDQLVLPVLLGRLAHKAHKEFKEKLDHKV
jgi:hypothetical protein